VSEARSAGHGFIYVIDCIAGNLRLPLQAPYGPLGFALCEWESLPGAATARD